MNKLNLYLGLGILCYMGLFFFFLFIDRLRFCKESKGTEQWYSWYWNKTLHTIYINKELNNFYFQHYTEPKIPSIFKTPAPKVIFYTPKVNTPVSPPSKINEVHELMNKVKGDI